VVRSGTRGGATLTPGYELFNPCRVSRKYRAELDALALNPALGGIGAQECAPYTAAIRGAGAVSAEADTTLHGVAGSADGCRSGALRCGGLPAAVGEVAREVEEADD